jgi:Putative Flp pilus-assembly TadE/G-like
MALLSPGRDRGRLHPGAPVAPTGAAVGGRAHEGREPRGTGQILVMYALLLPVLLGMTALGIDVAHLYAERRAIQNAADLAALAGANDLPDAADTAKTVALDYASRNGYTNGSGGISVVPVAPYGGDDSQIEVEITSPTPTFFAAVLGAFFGGDDFGSVDISARAVAESNSGSYAIFANRNGCSQSPPSEEAIHWGGQGATVDGKVHSNDGIKVSGGDNTITEATTYRSGCDLHVSGSNNTFGSGPTEVGKKKLPATFTKSDFACTWSRTGSFNLNDSGDWWVNGDKNSNRLRSGVYCVTDGKLVISGSDTTSEPGGVTFVAIGTSSEVSISGSNFDLKPHTKNVLIYSEGTGADSAKLSGSGGSWEGIIYTPNGQTDISGSSNFSLRGSIIADTVKLSGSNWGITRFDYRQGRPRLVE